MFSEADLRQLEPLHRLLLAEARRGHFEPRLKGPVQAKRMRRNLEAILREGRRTDEPLRAQLLAWRRGERVAGWLVNSEILPGAGNELWLVLVRPELRGQGEGGRMLDAALEALSGVDVYVRCYPASAAMLRLLQSRGFVVLNENADGTRELKRPADPAAPLWSAPNRQRLKRFVAIGSGPARSGPG
ncbi:MAG: GNAT family N-acetyltransferase [Chromatiales bacterium]|jgi:GNAT superfamily N-acetyltransferase